MAKKYLPFIELKPISELPSTSTLDPGGSILIELADGTAKKMTTDVFYQILNNIARPIFPTDTGPYTAITWHKPMQYSVDPGTNYPNAGNLKAIEGYDTLFFYNGTAWVKYANKLPQSENKIDNWVAGNYSSGKQVIYTDQSIYEANSNVISSDVPGVSSKWVKKVSGGSDPNITQAVGSFAVPPGDQTIKYYKFTDTDQALFGVSPASGLLKSDNTLAPYSEPGFSFKTWLNVPINNFNELVIKLVRLGGSSTSPTYVNLIGRKSDGSTDLLIVPVADPATGNFETLTVDVTLYQYISIYLSKQDSSSNIPEITFIKKGGDLQYDSIRKYINYIF